MGRKESYDDALQRLRVNVKSLLDREGYSISSFSDMNDIDRANLSRVLSGKQRDLRFSTLFKIAKGFGMSIPELIEWDPSENA